MTEYRDYGPAAPHGPDMTGTRDTQPDITPKERQIFDYLLKPDDSYNEAGVYWGDMSLADQVKFVSSGDAKESKRELSNIWAMFKNDPLSPFAYYFKNMVLPGAGLGLEGWVRYLKPEGSVTDSLAMFSFRLATSNPCFKPRVLFVTAGRPKRFATPPGYGPSIIWRSLVSSSVRSSLAFSAIGRFGLRDYEFKLIGGKGLAVVGVSSKTLPSCLLASLCSLLLGA